MIAFTVRGKPEPQGSMRTFIQKGKAVLTSDNPNLKGWRDAIAWEARNAMGSKPTMAGPVVVEAQFRLRRPKSHYGANGVRPSAPSHPTTKPDGDKLMRALLDALTAAQVFGDDAQVVALSAAKVYAESPGVFVRVGEVAS